MRNVKLYIATSVDGFIAKPDGGVDWLYMDDDYGYEEFFNAIDTVLIGRKTYEQILEFGEYPYKGKTSYVFSRSKDGQNDQNAHLVAPQLPDFVDDLCRVPGKDIWLVGGADLIESFLKYRLIDEFILSIHPIILGQGIPLFRGDPRQTDLVFLKSIPFKSGLVQLHYERKKG